MKLFKSFAVILMSMIIFSCSKDDVSKSSQTLSLSKKGKGVTLATIPSENPYDYIGVKHNEFLAQYFNEQYPKPSVEGTISFFEGYGFNGFYESFPGREIVIDKTMSLSSFTESNEQIPEHLKAYGLELFATIESNNPQALVDLENTILTDESLNEKDAQTLLVSVAIARHSQAYWNEHLNDWGIDDGIMAAQDYVAIDAGVAYATSVACNLGYLTPTTGMTVASFSLATGATASAAAALADGFSFVKDQIGENTGWW